MASLLNKAMGKLLPRSQSNFYLDLFLAYKNGYGRSSFIKDAFVDMEINYQIWSQFKYHVLALFNKSNHTNTD